MVEPTAYKPLRGVHFYLPGRGQIPFFKRVLTWLSGLGYNTLFLEIGGGMRYERHPAINAAWERFCAEATAFSGGAFGIQRSQPFPKDSTHTELGSGSYLEKAEVADLVSYARALGIDVIPEVQTFSHSYYLCGAYPEIAERGDDPWPDTKFCRFRAPRRVARNCVDPSYSRGPFLPDRQASAPCCPLPGGSKTPPDRTAPYPRSRKMPRRFW